MMSRDMEIFARQMEQLREGNLELHPDVNGETSYSREPLCELRTYIRALEAGYMERGKQLAVFRAIREVSLQHMLELEERDAAEEPVDLMRLGVEGPDPFWTGYCRRCGQFVSEGKDAFCRHCGQRVHWPEAIPADWPGVIHVSREVGGGVDNPALRSDPSAGQGPGHPAGEAPQ